MVDITMCLICKGVDGILIISEGAWNSSCGSCKYTVMEHVRTQWGNTAVEHVKTHSDGTCKNMQR